MAKKRQSTASSDFGRVTASVQASKAVFQEIVKEMQKLVSEGKSAKEIFDKYNEKVTKNLNNVEAISKQLSLIKKETLDILNTQSLTSEDAERYGKTLQAAVSLEKQLKSAAEEVKKQVQDTFVEEQRLFRLKEQAGKKEIENFEKKKKSTDEVSAAKVAEARMTNEAEEATRKQLESQKLLKAEIKEGNARRTEDVKAYYARVKDFQNKRAARQKQINEKAAKEQQQLLRDEIKENNSRRTEEVKAFERRQKAFRDARVRRLKEIGQLEKQQAREREAAAKAQLEINLKMAKRGGGGFGGGTLEQERDAQKKILQEYRKRYDQQSKEYKQLTLRLLRIDESYESQIATRDRNLDKGRQDAAKREENRQKGLNRARREVFKAELDLSKESANKKIEAVNKYYGSELRNLRVFGKENTEEYKKLYAEQLRLLKKYNKQAAAEEKAAQKEADKATSSKPKKGFLRGVREGFNPGDLGKAVGRLTGIGSVVKVLRDSFRFLRKAIVDSFTAAVDFEAQLAQLQAVTGVSNRELDSLAKSVLDVAGSTTFTSEQIVELQTELGKLGFSSSQIIDATEGIARTAQALGEKVGPVAQRVGQILQQYSLNASETVKVSDTLVSTINSSALSFESFSTALQYIGPLAAEAGTKFEETAAAMAVLANNGFTASRIGTGLRGILTELSATGEDLNSVIRRLADGNLSFGEAIELVGKRNAAQLISLVDNVEELEKANTKYYEAGSAAIASAQQIDTFKGNMQLLNSALNRVQISFGNLIKDSRILRFALKLLDEEGYKTTKSAEQLAEANTRIYSQGLEERSKFLASIANAGGDITFSTKAAAQRIVKESVIEPLAAEYTELRQLMKEIEAEYGNPMNPNIYMADERYKEAQTRAKEIRDILGTGTVEITRLGENAVGYTIDVAAAYDNLSESIEATINQLEGLTEQQRIDSTRTAIENTYKKDIEERQKLRRDEFQVEFTGLRKVAQFQAENEAKAAQLRELANQSRAKEAGLSGLELDIQKAKTEELENQKQNYVNLLYIREEMFQFAQKEYEKEFAELSNNLQAQKQSLDNQNKMLDIEIETIQNKLEGNITEEEKAKLIERQLELESEKLANQEETFRLSEEAIDKQYDQLSETKELWGALGYDVRLLDKAFARLENIRLNSQGLAVDFDEVEKGARQLGEGFKKKFGETLEKGQELTSEQKAFVDQFLDGFVQQFGGALSDEEKGKIKELVMSTLVPDPKDAKRDAEKRAKDLAKLVLEGLSEAADAYNDTALENTQNRLKAELDAIKERYKTEEDIIKSQLDNQLITESQFRTKQNELKRKQIQEENEINRKIFEAEKKADLNSVVIDTLEAIASNAINNYGKSDTATATLQTTLGYAAIIASGAAKADAIRRRKFFPVQFEQGGMVEGPSHADGGVPFTVQGRGGYEMEGGEFIVNKRAAAFHRSLLERINSSVKPNTSPLPMQYATGGLVAAQRATQVTVNAQTEESVNYLKAIAHATICTANDVKKPVRAVVSSKDLSNNETERRLRERNDRI